MLIIVMKRCFQAVISLPKQVIKTIIYVMIMKRSVLIKYQINLCWCVSHGKSLTSMAPFYLK